MGSLLLISTQEFFLVKCCSIFFQVLDLSGSRVPSLGRGAFLRRGLRNLQRVFLAKCGLREVRAGAFTSLTNLVELDVSNNRLAEVPSEAWADGQDLSSLMRLKMAANPIKLIRR